MTVLNLPPALLAVHVTVPMGEVWEPGLVSVTVTVRIIDFPWLTDAGFGVIPMLVRRLVTVRLNVPEDVASCLSPT